MKRILTIMLLAIAASIASGQNLNVGNFTKIEVDGPYEVKITKSDICSAKLEASEDLAQLADVRVKEGKLHLSLKGSVNMKRDSYLKVSICMPYIEKIEVDDLGKIEMSGRFKVNGSEFKVEMDGVTSIKGLDIEAERCVVEQDGVSKLYMKGNFTSFKLETDGSSDAQLEVTTKEFDCEADGVSKFKGVKTQIANIEMDGTSKGELEVTKSLSAELDGCSKLTYTGPNTLEISKKIGFTSKLEKR